MPTQQQPRDIGTDANMEKGLDEYNLISWLTVRNDDWYFLHWADPQFVRDYVNNFPEVDKYVNAFYIGADGWVFTKEFLPAKILIMKKEIC